MAHKFDSFHLIITCMFASIKPVLSVAGCYCWRVWHWSRPSQKHLHGTYSAYMIDNCAFKNRGYTVSLLYFRSLYQLQNN